MDHISRVNIFLEVVRNQSFVGAARCLGMTGSAISKQVQALEDQLGVRLLHRTTRQVSLTEEGAIYSERARKALEDLKEAEQQVQELKSCPVGLLRLNAPMSFGKRYLTKPITAFAKKYPRVQMEVDFDDRQVDMVARGYDVIVRIGMLKDSSLIARQLATCPIILCASPALISRFGLPNRAEDLSAYPAVIYSKHSNAAEWRYRHISGDMGVVPLKRHFTADNAEMMVEACLEGLGLALIPAFVATPYLQAGQLVAVLPEYKTYPERHICALFPKNRHLSAKTRLLVDWLAESCKSLPW